MNKVSTLEYQRSILEEKYKEEKRAHENTRAKLSLVCENAQKEENYLSARIESRNFEIQSLENTVRSLKNIIDCKEEEMYKMKLHVGSITDVNAGSFTEVGKKKTSRATNDASKVKHN
jgi:predicted RNase H-like nuclease (RuvC/YqgF family)